jgi:hypothetical protein
MLKLYRILLLEEVFMGLKPLIIIFLIIMGTAGYLIGGSKSVSINIENFIEEKYKDDPVNYEKYTFMNAVYCNWTAKYDRALEILDKYDLRFELEENKEKSQFLRATTYDNMLSARKARAEYQKYMENFPKGKNFEKARERYLDLKTYT